MDVPTKDRTLREFRVEGCKESRSRPPVGAGTASKRCFIIHPSGNLYDLLLAQVCDERPRIVIKEGDQKPTTLGKLIFTQ